MEPVFCNDWAVKDYVGRIGLESMKDDFRITDEQLKGAKILLASYGTGGYEGSAFVLFRRGGKLFEVNGSHCSCYGLEDQWDPQETTKAELMHRLDNGRLGQESYCDNNYAEQLRAVLKKVRAK